RGEGGEEISGRSREGLRNCQCEYRKEWRRDWRGIWRREKYQRRTQEWKRLLEELHAPPDQHDQLLQRAAARTGNSVRRRRGEFDSVNSPFKATRGRVALRKLAKQN